MGSNGRTKVKPRLSESRVLRIEHDICIEQFVWLATGHERQHDMTMGRERFGQADCWSGLLRCEIVKGKWNEDDLYRASSNGLPSRSV